MKPDQHLCVTITPSNLALCKGLKILLLSSVLLTVRLWRCNARAICDEQIHHGVTRDVHRGRRHHVAKGDRAACTHIGGDGARDALAVVVGAHVALELGWCLAVDATELADKYAASGCASKAPGTVLPLLTMMLLSMDAKVCQGGETAIAEMAGVVL